VVDSPTPSINQATPLCANHPGTEAVARCISCHRPVCGFCRVVLDNRNYCSSCAALYTQYTPPPYQPAYGEPPQESQPSPGGYYGFGYPPYQPAAPLRYRKQREVVFPGAPWGVGEAVIIFAISFFAASALSFSVYLALKATMSATTALFLLIFLSSVLLYALLLGGTYFSVKVRHRSTITALGLKFDGLGAGLANGIGLGVPLFMGAMLLAYVSTLFFRNPTSTDVLSRSLNKVSSGGVNVGLIFLLFVTLVVLAPVCEEIFFRGYLYPALRNRMDKQPAMLLNGMFFAAAHFEIIGFLPRFFLGYGLCYIYERRNNLSGPIAGHALYNGLILLLEGFLQIF
jgi:membrane protease YdiL (CAAX protease family)